MMALLCFVGDYARNTYMYSWYVHVCMCGGVPPHVALVKGHPPLVFDCLQYANMEGEGLGDLVTCDDIR